MAIGYRGAVGKITATTSTNTGTVLPVATAAGDAMVAAAWYSGTTQTLTVPTGWTTLVGPVDKGTSMRLYLLYRVATAADSGATVLWDWSSAGAIRNTEVAVLSGTDTTTPVLDKATLVETTTGTGHVSPVVSRAGIAGCWGLEFYSDRGSPASTTISASGLTTRDSQIGTGGGSITTAVASTTAALTGASAGGTTWTGDLSTATAILATLVLQPAVATGPTGLTATPVNSARIDLAWTAVAGATGYDVERNFVVVASPTTNSYSDTGLSPATAYGYRVRSAS